MSWIAEVDRLDRMLNKMGVPPNARFRAVAQIADALARADHARRQDDKNRLTVPPVPDTVNPE